MLVLLLCTSLHRYLNPNSTQSVRFGSEQQNIAQKIPTLNFSCQIIILAHVKVGIEIFGDEKNEPTNQPIPLIPKNINPIPFNILRFGAKPCLK